MEDGWYKVDRSPPQRGEEEVAGDVAFIKTWGKEHLIVSLPGNPSYEYLPGDGMRIFHGDCSVTVYPLMQEGGIRGEKPPFVENRERHEGESHEAWRVFENRYCHFAMAGKRADFDRFVASFEIEKRG